MRVLLQRATWGRVSVAGEVIGQLPRPGLVALVGIARDDDRSVVEKLARKTWDLRILSEERSCSDVDAPVLAVSQFTLYANCRKGRRPSWSAAAPGEVGEPLFDAYVAALRALGAHVETGRFGAEMAVELCNDGPFTVLLDSAELA